MKLPLFALLVVLAPPLLAQTTRTWNTNTAAAAWSAPGNWDPSGTPSGNDLIFGDDAGETANATTVGNVVDQDYTLNSLTYNNTGTSGNFWQVTEIGSGFTLTLNSASVTPPATIFSVGGVASASTRAAIRGSGSLVINEAASSIYVGGPTSGQSTTLDLSGLGSFSATVATVNFGGDSSRAQGDVLLADNNTITATTFNLGTSTASTSSGVASDLTLGQSNVIHADTINVGKNYGGGTIVYRGGLTAPTTEIRGTAGGNSRTDLNVGTFVSSFGINNNKAGSADFSGGSVDALINQLNIGSRTEATANVAGTTSGSFIMDSGTVDVNAVTLGQTTYTSGTPGTLGSMTATLNVKGGSFTVNGGVNMAQNVSGPIPLTANLLVSGTGSVTIAGNVTAGSQTGSAGTVAANVVVSGGTLLIQGNLAEGSGGAGVTSSVTVSGGTLDLDHGTLSVDHFTQTAGTLKNVASFAATATGGLNLQNSSKLAFDINSSFSTLNLAGTLTLGAGSDLILTLADGYVPGSSFTLVANDLSDAISGTFATLNGAAFGAGDTFFLTNNQGTYQYRLLYDGGTGNDLVMQLVPEPSAAALLLGGAVVLGTLRRRARGG